MIGALNNGKIGLLSFENAISVESNNVSNATTIGHKEDNVTFEDMMYKNGYGKGVNIQNVEKSFSQGNVQLTNVNLDVAIEGKGMFVINDRSTGLTYYTRAGNFQQGEDGFLETQELFKVQGLSPQEKNITATDINDTLFTDEFSNFIASIDISHDETVYNHNVKTTDYNSAAVDDTISGQNYKTASSKIDDVELLKNDFLNKIKLLQSNFDVVSTPSQKQISEVDFSSQLPNLKNQNDFIRVQIDGVEYKEYFDSDIQTTLNNLSDKLSNTEGFNANVSTNGVLTIESLVPGKEFKILEANLNSEYVPVSKIQESIQGTGLAMLDSSRQALKEAVENAGGKYLEITNVLSYKDKTVIGNEDINLRLNALGLVEDIKGEVSISDDGLVYVTNDNNSFLVSKISTTHFRNMQGLNPEGSNIFKETLYSGEALNADDLSTLVSKSIETSNASYSNSLSKLLFYQKAFEANSKSITVSDEFLNTAIQMKK